MFKKQQVGGVPVLGKLWKCMNSNTKNTKIFCYYDPKNPKFKEITDEEDNDLRRTSNYLNHMKMLIMKTSQKGIKAFDNIFEACDRMIAIANAHQTPCKKKEKFIVGGKNAVQKE